MILYGVKSSAQEVLAWHLRTEEELLHEACVCMFSSQMVFEVAEAVALRIKDRGLLKATTSQDYEKKLAAALSEPLRIEKEEKGRHARPRFKNRLVSLLSTTVRTMRAQGQASRASCLMVDTSQVRSICGCVRVELLHHVPYSADMAPKSLIEHNPHLRNAQEYQRALRASVLSSIAIEGMKKAAERALNKPTSKAVKHG